MVAVKKFTGDMRERCKAAMRTYFIPYRWEYCLGGILVALVLFSQMYYDFFVTYRAGINFWYALFEGHPLSFYSYAGAIQGATPNRVMSSGAAYDFTIYAFFAIWNLPAYLYERISGSHAESFGAFDMGKIDVSRDCRGDCPRHEENFSVCDGQ